MTKTIVNIHQMLSNSQLVFNAWEVRHPWDRRGHALCHALIM